MGIKRFVYGLPVLGWYRNGRTRKLAQQHKLHFGGFEFAGTAFLHDPDSEREERQCLSDQMAHTDIFIDIGANYGLYSCMAASKGLQVAAVEPESGNLRFLMSNVRKNDFPVEIFATALGSDPGVMKIYGDGDTASLVEGWASASSAFSAMVPVNTMDNLFADRWAGQRILIKVDVEGFELTVLKGAVRTLARSPGPVWLIETFPRMYDADRSENCDFMPVFDLMFENGYECRHSQGGFPVDRAQIHRWMSGEDAETLQRGNFLFHRFPDAALPSGYSAIE